MHSTHLAKHSKNAKATLLEYLPLIIAVVFWMVIHFDMHLNDGDTADFQWMHANFDYLTFLSRRWQHWTSRLIIESLLYFQAVHLRVFPFIELAINIGLWFALRGFVQKPYQKQAGWLITLLLLSYPYLDLDSAGWVATILNYWWPMACAVFVLALLARQLNLIASPAFKKPVPRVLLQCLTVLLLAIAANMELLAIPFILVLIACCIYAVQRKTDIKFLLICLAVVVAELVLELICPGNHLRNTKEIAEWTVFANLSLPVKFLLGFESTMAEYLYGHRILLLALSIYMAVILETQNVSKPMRIISWIPTTLMLVFPLLQHVLAGTSSRLLGGLLAPDLTNGVPRMGILLVSIIILAVLALELYAIFGRTKQGAAAFILVICGFMTRISMGFSPTLFRSGNRTFLFCDLALMGVMLLLYRNHHNRLASDKRFALYLLLALAAGYFTAGVLHL